MSEDIKTHWKKYFNYEYLGTDSLPNGEDLILTIKELKTEDVIGSGGKKDTCLICYFHEDIKPMIMNRTNCKTIAKIYETPYTEEWGGYKIQLFAKNGIQAFGTITDGLRIREIKPQLDELKDIKAKVRTALGAYKGEDLTAIKVELNEAVELGKADEKFFKSILKKIA